MKNKLVWILLLAVAFANMSSTVYARGSCSGGSGNSSSTPEAEKPVSAY